MKKIIVSLVSWLFVLGGFFFVVGSLENLANPTNDEVGAHIYIFMLILGVLGFVGGITALVIAYRRSELRRKDTDGDGIPGDGLPATSEQKALIERRFRDMGQYIDKPTKDLTQGQAREILRNIDTHASKKEQK
jgi:hypothetical protein